MSEADGGVANHITSIDRSDLVVPGRGVSVEAWAKRFPAIGDFHYGLGFRLYSTTGAASITTGVIQSPDFSSYAIWLNQPTISDAILVGSAPSLVSDSIYYKLKFQIYLSTVNSGGDGVNPDGCVALWFNDVRVIVLGGLRVYCDGTDWASGINRPPDSLQIFLSGYLDDVTVTDETMPCGASVNLPPPTSSPCCGQDPPAVPPGSTPGTPNPPGTPPSTQPGPVNPPSPTEPLPPWVAACAGGGVVPTAADLTDAEDWSV
jgi:hypothetical protein